MREKPNSVGLFIVYKEYYDFFYSPIILQRDRRAQQQQPQSG
jgi:hypothetical protein